MEKETDNAPVEPEEVKDAALEAAPERARKSWLRLGLRFISSLRLTVALLGMAVFIVLAGTVAQVDQGLWTVVDKYFRTTLPVDVSIPVIAPHGIEIPWFCWVEFSIFFPRDWSVPGGIYFPGGWLIGSVLLVNLVAAHMVRFKINAKGARLAWGLLALVAGTVLTWMVVQGAFLQNLAITDEAAFWRVLWRLANGQIAALVLLGASWILFSRKAGMVLVHGGIILMLVAEVITGSAAVEGKMSIMVGQSANFIHHDRDTSDPELAVIDTSGASNKVTVIPAKILRADGIIQHELLPFDVEVEEYMVNSDIHRGFHDGEKPWADRGRGRLFHIHSQPETSGAATDQTIDFPSAKVILKEKGSDKELARLELSSWYDGVLSPAINLNPADTGESVRVGNHIYEVALRFRRTYKPYTLHLKKFTHDKYVGTQTAKDFRATVRLEDKLRNVDRDNLEIWMNNPMRYEGETFYQSSVRGKDQGTILQVVRNAGWMIPYVSCMIVATGLLAHFIMHLVGYLREKEKRA